MRSDGLPRFNGYFVFKADDYEQAKRFGRAASDEVPLRPNPPYHHMAGTHFNFFANPADKTPRPYTEIFCRDDQDDRVVGIARRFGLTNYYHTPSEALPTPPAPSAAQEAEPFKQAWAAIRSQAMRRLWPAP